VRIRATPSGLELGAGAGRGAWLCRLDPVACLDEARRRKSVDRALRAAIRSDDIERLRARLVGREVPVNDETGATCSSV